jgi:cold shock CspA family protein
MIHYPNFPVIYVGSNLDDSDIRAILLDLKQNIEIVPRSYLVLPNLKSAEKAFWETTFHLSCIDMTFEGFLQEINTSIPTHFRGIAVLQTEFDHPICNRFTTGNATIPDNVRQFLSRDVIYIDSQYKPTELTAQQFYKGYFKDLSPIAYSYDIKRTLTDSILSEVFLLEEAERTSKQEFYLIRGHAGSGKSILLQRLFWDAANLFNKLCLLLNTDIIPDYEALLYIYQHCNERIFLCVDPVHKYQEIIASWLSKAKRDNLPLTIVGAERNHEWNVSCADVYKFVNETYELKYLIESEIDSLIAKLTEHKSLGFLKGLSLENQKQAFKELTGNQLLVALYEATQGKPFSEIILNEYKSIVPLQAQSLYLTICILYRLGIPTRAGLISRVHGIEFEEFKRDFFQPLEFIVFDYKDKLTGDKVYRTRHPVIAEMVFEQVLIDEQSRFDEYIRILNNIDIGYYSDRQAFIKLINARELMRLFRNTQFIRKLYETVNNRIGEDTFLWQQEAIFEMNSTDGKIDIAGELLRKALIRQPNNRLIKHSLSEWAYKKAGKVTTPLEKNKYLNESQKISKELTADEVVSPYAFVTLIKIGLEELIDIMQSGDSATIERKIGDIERIIANAKQIFPDDSFILTEEYNFCEIVNRNPEALQTLEKAFSANKGSPYIAVRLAHLYKTNNPEKAIEVLSECVKAKSFDKYSNYNLATLLMKYHPEKVGDIKHHLRRSFTDGDVNYAAQFWYARLLYLEGPNGDAIRLFNKLYTADLDPTVKMELRGLVVDSNSKPITFSGIVAKIEHSFGFIKRDGYQDRIFMHRSDSNEIQWANLKEGDRVNFEMGFSYRGPKGTNIRKEGTSHNH